jgi:hypothetical protein
LPSLAKALLLCLAALKMLADQLAAAYQAVRGDSGECEGLTLPLQHAALPEPQYINEKDDSGEAYGCTL